MTKILYIEDEAILRDDIAEELHHAGFEVATAVDGVDGLQEIQRVQPDLVISDIFMPKMNGRELLKELRTHHKEYDAMPFILVSALTDRESRDDPIAPATDFLTKPIDFEELIKVIRSYC